jgi:nitrogen fixation protein NifX
MRVAFASKDGEFINEHFGWCERFYIYEINEEDYSFVCDVDSSLKFENEVEKLEYKINSLEQSDIVYVQQIGPKASTMVKMAGVYPMKSTYENEKIIDICESFQKLMKSDTPIWLQRILAKAS